MGCCDGDLPPTPEGAGKHVNFQSEPLHRKRCTDIICLLFFIACIGAWGFVAFIAIQRGDLSKFIMAVDSDNHRCGHDSEVLTKPKLLNFDIEKCFSANVLLSGCKTKSTCIEECPKKSFVYKDCNDLNFNELKKDIICAVNLTQVSSCKDLNDLILQGKCAKYYFESISFSNICIPKPEKIKDVYEAQNLSKIFTEDNILKKVFNLAEISKEGTRFYEEMKEEWMTICWLLLLSIAVCFVFIYLLKWFSGVIVWVSILGTLGSLGFGVYHSYLQYTFYKKNPVERDFHETNLKAIVMNFLTKADTWLYILIGISIIFSVLTFATLCLYKGICLGVNVIREGSRIISDTMCSIFWPIIPWIIQISILIFGIYIYANHTTMQIYNYKTGGISSNCECPIGDSNDTFYTNGTTCDPWKFECTSLPNCESSYCHFINTTETVEVKVQKYYNGFMCLWCLFFISAFSDMVLAVAFSKWFWTYKKSNVPFCVICDAVGRCLLYHIGTLAFGSLIITFCRILRLFVEYIDQTCKKYNNSFTKALICIFRCLFWCLEKFMKFVSKNAYIMTAIHGTNFCTSAKNAFVLLASNILREVNLGAVRLYIFFMSKVFLSSGMGLLTYFVVHKEMYNYPAIIVAIGTYFIAETFFSVFSMAVDTYFLCALVDAQENDGTADKPFYMSRRLSRQLVDGKDSRRRSEFEMKNMDNERYA